MKERLIEILKERSVKRERFRLPFFYLTVQLAHAVPHAVPGPRAEVL